jgi:hypothetical protein
MKGGGDPGPKMNHFYVQMDASFMRKLASSTYPQFFTTLIWQFSAFSFQALIFFVILTSFILSCPINKIFIFICE